MQMQMAGLEHAVRRLAVSAANGPIAPLRATASAGARTRSSASTVVDSLNNAATEVEGTDPPPPTPARPG